MACYGWLSFLQACQTTSTTGEHGANNHGKTYWRVRLIAKWTKFTNATTFQESAKAQAKPGTQTQCEGRRRAATTADNGPEVAEEPKGSCRQKGTEAEVHRPPGSIARAHTSSNG